MYPTIHSYGDAAGGTQNPLHAPYPSTSGPAGPPPPPGPASPPRTNGPPAGPPAQTAQPAFPTLQVAIDPKFALAPPVQAPPQPPGEGGQAAGAGGAAPPPPPGHPAPGSKEPLDLTLEKKLVEDLAASSSSGGGSGGGSNGHETGPQHEDPYELLLRRYTAQGYSREEAALALTVVGPEAHEDAAKVADACKKLREMFGAGLKREQSVAALILARGNLEEAADMCLAAGEAGGH